MPIPVLDLGPEIEELWPELNAAFERVVKSKRFILGPEVHAFEEEVAAFLGSRYAVGVNSGTDAIVIGLRAMGVGPGDEVITTPFSFFASAEGISNVGATPVFGERVPEGLQKLLRRGILTVAILTILVSLYALSAVVYRSTDVYGMTINRLTIIGWNSINIVLLVSMVVRLLRAEDKTWIQRIKEVIGVGTIAYAIWTGFLVFGIPLIFR